MFVAISTWWKFIKSECRGSLDYRGELGLNELCCFPETFTFSLQIDFDDVTAINPELLELLPLQPKDNLPLQENVTGQVGACHLAAASAPADPLGSLAL